MTFYNFNKGIGWASSGVEYAQAYRSTAFRKNGQKAKFIFTELFTENLQPLTKNIGFEDEEIIWMYQFFTDTKVSPTTYTLEDLELSFASQADKVEKLPGVVRYIFTNKNLRIVAYLDTSAQGECVYKTETIMDEKLLQRDYYTYIKIFSEYFKPGDKGANLYQRRFFNSDGTVAYDELLNGAQSLYLFEDRTIYSFENLFLYFMEKLSLTKKDILIMDRSTTIGPLMVRAKGEAKLGVVIHAEHFSESLTNDDHILWNNYYDYQFKNARSIDFYISSTEIQKEILEAQFAKYEHTSIKVYTLPVGSVDVLKTSTERKPYSLVTASRLASEKHLDWLIKATVEAKKDVPELTLDIYGEGALRGELAALISSEKAEDYIFLRGQQDLEEVYKNYSTYVAASTSEGFGLSLLEAVGSGLGMIGFDVPYGNPTFISEGKNGYLIPYDKRDTAKNIQELAQAMVKMNQLSSAKNNAVHESSYEIARPFLTEAVQKLWVQLEEEVLNG